MKFQLDMKKIGATLLFAAIASVANAGAIHDAGQFTTVLPGNDDGSTGLVSLGFNVNFFGTNYSQIYVNNNGNITFNGPLGTFTPFGISGVSTPMLAPFFADVDTRIGAPVTYGTGSIDGHQVFGVNWIDVGYFSTHLDKTNNFQLIIVDRSDTGAGNFDFEFNYDSILWETGDASGGSNGLGGTSAAAGWTNGAGTSYSFAGSLINGALLDGGPNALIDGTLNSDTDGQYIFEVRNGVVGQPSDVPEPATEALLAIGLMGLTLSKLKKRRS